MNEQLAELGRHAAATGDEAYFVGGCVRDLLRGESIKDVDIAVTGSTYALGRKLAQQYHGHVFWLREEDQVARVVLPGLAAGGTDLQLDLVQLKGTLEADLRARDLTINAMAVAVAEGLVPSATVVDPTGGREDLAARVLRFVSPQAPVDDPLRTLRALRFRWKLGFELAPDTEARLRECVPLLERVSTERIRDELFQLLSLPDAAEPLAECLRVGMARWLFGKPVAVPDADGEPLPAARVCRQIEVLAQGPPDLVRLLSQEVTPPRLRREVLLWAAALETFGPALDPGAAARHLALSNDERLLVVGGIQGCAAARDLVRRWPAPGRMRYRLFRQARRAGPEAVLLAAAVDGWSPAYAELLDEALHRHFWPQPPLLNGIEIMQILNLEPGPRIGAAMEAVEEARADGLLRTHAEAVAWLRQRSSS